ncbi:MAG: hypothetical protein M1833_004679 [Piccolia ochrophora]|nr:MAG: hypothetical protein M1833_004679 [Piccolia ochrophora]
MLNHHILTGTASRQIALFNASTTSQIQSYDAHAYAVLDLAVAPDNARFASVGGDKQVFLWDVATARTLRRWTGHFGRVNCVAFGGEADRGEAGGVVVSGSFDSTIRIWDARSQSTKPIQVLEEARDSVSCLQVVGHEICSGSVDGRVRVYDLRMGMVYVDVVGHPVTSLALTRDGAALLVSSLDGCIRLLDKGSGKLLQSYSGHKNTEYRVRSGLAMNDAFVVSGSEDGQVWVWDVVEGEVVTKVDVRAAEERAASSKDSKTVVVGALALCEGRKEWACGATDGTVQIWGE